MLKAKPYTTQHTHVSEKRFKQKNFIKLNNDNKDVMNKNECLREAEKSDKTICYRI